MKNDKIFAGLLIVAAGAGAWYFYKKNKEEKQVAAIKKEAKEAIIPDVSVKTTPNLIDGGGGTSFPDKISRLPPDTTSGVYVFDKAEKPGIEMTNDTYEIF